MRLNCILIKISIGLLIVGLGMSVCLTFLLQYKNYYLFK